MASSPLVVNVVELVRQPGSVRQVRTVASLAELDATDPRLGDRVGVDVTLESTLDDIVVTGTLTVDWSDECRRCLRPLSDTLEIGVEERYTESADVDPIVNGQIDLRPMVREEVLLSAPEAPLCREDCPGLCPVCGADLQSEPSHTHPEERDERWAVLDQLRDQ